MSKPLDLGAEAADGHVPAFEDLPSFEEERRVTTQPNAIVRAVLDGRSPAGEQFRLLAARIRALGRDKRLRRIGVVGAALGEGTTRTGLSEYLQDPLLRLTERDRERPAARARQDRGIGARVLAVEGIRRGSLVTRLGESSSE